jgi:hypothetical protein
MSLRTLSPHAMLSQHHLRRLLAYGRCSEKVGTVGYTIRVRGNIHFTPSPRRRLIRHVIAWKT